MIESPIKIARETMIDTMIEDKVEMKMAIDITITNEMTDMNPQEIDIKKKVNKQIMIEWMCKKRVHFPINTMNKWND